MLLNYLSALRTSQNEGMGVSYAGVFSEFIPVYFFVLWPG